MGGEGTLRVHAAKRFAFRFSLSTVALIVVVFWLCNPAGAQEPKVSITPRENPHLRVSPTHPNLKIDSSLVLVPVTVTDASDRPVTDLASDAFRVFEDNIEQQVLSLHREEGPVSVGFIFDASASMKNRMDPSIDAVRQFLTTLNKGDEFFLIRFSDKPTLLTDFTGDSEFILSSLSSVQPEGWTALNDAITMGVQRMKRAKNPRRALFVLTDGGDNNSRYSDSEVRNLVRESDVRVYSIGLFERPSFLEKLAADTGGTTVWAHKLKDLPDVVDKISRDFRNQYVLGYAPAEKPRDGKYHSVRVEIKKTLKLMQLNVFWRRGYFAPPD
jgi:Ca-activated chloride channel homolog